MFNIGDEVIYVNNSKGTTEGPSGKGDKPFHRGRVGNIYKVVRYFYSGVYISKDGTDKDSFSAFNWRLEPVSINLENE